MPELEKFSNLIHYLEIIPDEIISSPIIFLHGWGLSALTFAPSLRMFPGKVFAPDLPGFGKTTLEVSSWDYETLAKIILSFADRLGLEQFHLVGHSMGGGISIMMCAIAPSRIKSLVLLNSAGKPIITKMNQMFIQKLIENVQQVIKTKFSPYNWLIFGPGIYNLFFNFAKIKAALKIPLSEDISVAASKITTKTLMVWGEKDRAIPLEAGIYLSNQIHNSRLIVLKDKFHEWGVLYPQILSETVNTFIIQVENEEKIINHRQ
jgi:pimeloyl-ACP methyl ester carboxylesterase